MKEKPMKEKRRGGLRIAIISVAIAVLLFMLVLFTPAGFIVYYTYAAFFEITELEVRDNTLLMSGEIGPKTPRQIRRVFKQHPNIDTILMLRVPGSLDDEANLKIAAWIADKGITTRVNRYSLIASGGTDFFLAGKQRIVEEGALIGVHSWGGFGETATNYPRGHEYHQPYIEYYQEIGFSRQQAEDFYYFTIDAAPAEEIHFMTSEEILRYGISTTGITPAKYYVPELEPYRQQWGVPLTSPAEARALGLRTITPADYSRLLLE